MISLVSIPKMCILIALLLSAMVTETIAQTVHRQISNIDGLSNNSINCIFEDSQSKLWIGTWDGLNVYNGREFKTYRYSKYNSKSISNNVIRQIIEEGTEQIWVATDYGINRWNRERQEFDSFFTEENYTRPSQEKSFLLAKTIRQKIICYVRELGFFYFDANTQKFKPLVIPSINGELKDFVIDKDNNIFFLTESQKVYQGKVDDRVDNVSVVFDRKVMEQSIPISNIFLSQDKLILDYGGYIKIIDRNNSFPTTIDVDRGKNISQIIFRDNSLYISYYEGGCQKYNLKEHNQVEIMEDLLGKTSVFSIYMGSQNILWIGTDGQGIYQIYEHFSPFKSVRTNHPVRSFCETDDKDILIGTKGDGLKLLKKGESEIVDYLSLSNGLTSNSVYALKKNRAGDIFIGGEGEGISILRSKTKKVEKLTGINQIYFKAVYSISFTDNDSVLWLGTSGYGLIKIGIHRQNGTYSAKNVKQFTSANTQNALNNNIIYTMMPDSDKVHLWIGTRGGGIYKFNTRTEIFKHLDDIYNISLTNNDILAIQTDAQKKLWVGTSYGLNRITLDNGAAKIEEYTDNEHLPSNTIHGVLEDANHTIWISTNAGISSINSNNNNTINTYTVNDGLQNNEFADGAYFKGDDNILYFGGVSGFSYFDPDKIHLRNFQPQLDLSSLRIDNTLQNIAERIQDNTLKLSNDESQIVFTFIARDFINNENCEYDYRLLNSSDEWTHNGNNPNIVFAKLPPGKYTLEVRCTNGDKVWSSAVYRIELHLAYPWWLSTSAFIMYVIIILIIAYITQSVIRNRIRLSKQILLEHIEKQHQEKIHESRLNFFTNVAHEFFTPLTLIYGPAQYLLEKSGLDNSTKHYIQIIKNNADRMQKLINELMEFRKLESGHTPLHPESVDIKMLVDYISDNYTEISQKNKINFTIGLKETSTIITDRNSLEKILFNLISNAFKYTPVGGDIHIEAKQNAEDGAFGFSIRNTGKGLTDRQMSQLFSKFKIFDNSKLENSTSTGIGLGLTKSLVELLGGTIDVNSQLSEYVEFRITIPSMQVEKSTETIKESDDIQYISYSDMQIQDKKGISILIIEDEHNIRELLSDILKPYYNVTESENGEDALKIIEQNVPDIIISDILMPKLDGISLMSRLKAEQRTVHIPIISISAKNSIEDHINAYEHGADLYITKPFHPRHVLVAIENLIGKNQILKDYFNSSRSSMTVKDGVVLHTEDEQFLHEIVSFIERNMEDESLSPNSISDFMGISKASLYRRLKESTDKTPSEFVRTIRLEYASKLLITTKLTVTEIMFRSGFGNKSYFYREFGKQYSLSPKEYRNTNAIK
ncbi:two-component regulator propeller domain-containing protein [Dysgonomonas capnocytophagoides]|uniref:two-component regulator propeller domain-containing protein n=1 Tax=Dysgonomonas capnocytophagoides TaxID=45254 RepID=UPI0030C7A67F